MYTIEITPYQAQWPQEFDKLAERLRTALGPMALAIEHIGSTAVPGLAAKDRIDIQVAVAGFDTFGELHRRLQAAGFVARDHITRDHRPPDDVRPETEWEKRLFTTVPGERAANIHIRVPGRANYRYPLLFRDYLHAHPQAAAAYAAVKHKLAHYHPHDIEAYVEIKDPVCDVIIAAAEDWARESGWHIGKV